MPNRDSNGNHDDHDHRPPRGVSPIVPGRAGRPSYSLDALRERIEAQFHDETAGRADILLELDTPQKRRAQLAEIADYVLATEAVTLAPADRARLVDRAYANLFEFGPLDHLLHDPAITEITINGPHNIHARRGLDAMQAVATGFDDLNHLQVMLQRMLASAGITLEEPFLETGVTLHGRPARLSVIGPPVRTDYSIEIRLHPADPVTLDALVTQYGVVDARAAVLLRAIVRGGHGVLVVGDAGTGKTTLAGALIQVLEPDTPLHTAERAAELALPPHAARHTPQQHGTFGAAFSAALDPAPAWLVADEVRSEDAAAIWDALTRDDPPHYLWVLRGARQPDRLKSALSMLVRQHVPAVPQQDINHALVEHLPFVVALRRAGGSPRLAYIAQWALDAADAAALHLRPLLEQSGDAWALTGTRPDRMLDLPDTFWNA